MPLQKVPSAEVVITGMALQSALGDLAETWEKLLQGQTGIHIYQPFPELPPLPLARGDKSWLSLNHLTQQLVAAVLHDADWLIPQVDCPVVIGSSRSAQPNWEHLAKSPNPGCVLDYLPHMSAITAARQIGSQAAVLAPMAACSTGIWSIAQGCQLIASGQYHQALVGAVEMPISPLTITGFQQLGVLAPTGCYPFDHQRQGLVLGEGGALFTLEDRVIAEQRGAKIYGRILGWGFTNDAYHPCAIEPSGTSTRQAIRQCLIASQLQSSDIDYIHVHGTATMLNDRHEAHVIQHLWPQSIPIGGSKGAVGHTLGASAAIGVALACQALQYQILPPSVGCAEPAFNLDIVQAARPSKLRQLLCWSFGFGGQNAVIAIGSV